MSEVTASIGEGSVLVLQPATPSGPAGLSLALGVQRFWQKSLKAAGRPAFALIMNTRIESIDAPPDAELPIAVGDRGVACIGGWPDENVVVELVRSRRCRWGLVASFEPAERSGRLATTLIEAPPEGPGRELGSWSLDAGYDALPGHVVDVLVETARRVGTRLSTTLANAFDTDDPGAAMFTLEQMGVLSMAEDGCRMEIGPVLDRLAVLALAAPRSRVAVALVPELLGHLARLGAHDLQLAGWLRGVRKATGALPPEWEGLVDRIGRERAR